MSLLIFFCYRCVIRDGACCSSSDEFVKDDVSALISYLSVECFYFVFFLFILFELFLSCVYFVYDLLQ